MFETREIPEQLETPRSEGLAIPGRETDPTYSSLILALADAGYMPLSHYIEEKGDIDAVVCSYDKSSL